MKRVLSYLLVVVLIFSSLGSFPFVNASEDGPYSGGSGTEDDPYLISTEADIRALRIAMETDPSLWYTKYYYKLTNDIETSYELGDNPMYEYDTDYKTADTDASYYKERLVPIYMDIYGEGDRHNPCTSAFDIRSDQNGYYNSYFNLFGAEGYPSYVTEINYYWNVAFTGVFDGNGYTIKMNNEGYFFGFVENEALIKNLTVEGEGASLAYCLDKTSVISNCGVNTSLEGNAVKYNYGKIVDGVTEDGFAYTVTENSEVYISALLEPYDTVVIPEAIEGMPVVGIGDGAFYFRNYPIEKLYIHKGIAEIKTNAFGPSRSAVRVGTIYYDGTYEMLYKVQTLALAYITLTSYYNIVYNDSTPIQGFALKDGADTVTLEVGDSFRPEYEFYPENARGQLSYSFGSQISVKKGLITAEKAGETTVTVTAESGVTYSFKVKVLGMTGIDVAKLPDRVNYSLRQSFDATGLKISKVYNDGTIAECTDYTISNHNALKKGVQTITVTYEGCSASFNIFVSDKMVGDVNLDGAMSSVDSNYLKRIIVGNMAVEEYTDGYFVCDMNGDGEINAMDSALLKMNLAGA